MFEVFRGMGDDQIALIGCASSLVFTGGVLWMGAFLSRRRDAQAEPVNTLQMRIHQPAVRPNEKAA